MKVAAAAILGFMCGVGVFHTSSLALITIQYRKIASIAEAYDMKNREHKECVFTSGKLQTEINKVKFKNYRR